MMDVNEVHMKNAHLQIFETDDGISIDLSELHPENVYLFITETDDGMMTDVNELHPAKAWSVMNVTDDGMIIHGGKKIHGADFKTYGDHRMAMSEQILSLVSKEEFIIKDKDCVAISFPDFWKLMESVTEE